MNPAGISSLPFRSTPSLLAFSIPIWQLGMLKKTNQTHQTKRCCFSPALRNTTRNHRQERLKALSRAAAAADWAFTSSQSLSTRQPNNLGRATASAWPKQSQADTAAKETGCRNPEPPHTQSYKFWTRKQNPNRKTTNKNQLLHCTTKRKCKTKSTSSHRNPETEVKG